MNNEKKCQLRSYLKALTNKHIIFMIACSFPQVLLSDNSKPYADKYNLVIHAYDKKFVINGKSMKSRQRISAYLKNLDATDYSRILIVKDSLMKKNCCFTLGEEMKDMGFKEPEYIQMPIKRNKAVLRKN